MLNWPFFEANLSFSGRFVFMSILTWIYWAQIEPEHRPSLLFHQYKRLLTRRNDDLLPRLLILASFPSPSDGLTIDFLAFRLCRQKLWVPSNIQLNAVSSFHSRRLRLVSKRFQVRDFSVLISPIKSYKSTIVFFEIILNVQFFARKQKCISSSVFKVFHCTFCIESY